MISSHCVIPQASARAKRALDPSTHMYIYILWFIRYGISCSIYVYPHKRHVSLWYCILISPKMSLTQPAGDALAQAWLEVDSGRHDDWRSNCYFAVMLLKLYIIIGLPAWGGISYREHSFMLRGRVSKPRGIACTVTLGVIVWRRNKRPRISLSFAARRPSGRSVRWAVGEEVGRYIYSYT